MSEYAELVRFPVPDQTEDSPEQTSLAKVVPIHTAPSLRAHTTPSAEHITVPKPVERRVVFIPDAEAVPSTENIEAARVLPLRLSDRVLGYVGTEHALQSPFNAAARYEIMDVPEAEPALSELFAAAEAYEHVDILPEVLLFASHYVRNAVAAGEQVETICQHAVELLATALQSVSAEPQVNVAQTERLAKAAETSDTLTRYEP